MLYFFLPEAVIALVIFKALNVFKLIEVAAQSFSEKWVLPQAKTASSPSSHSEDLECEMVSMGHNNQLPGLKHLFTGQQMQLIPPTLLCNNNHHQRGAPWI